MNDVLKDYKIFKSIESNGRILSLVGFKNSIRGYLVIFQEGAMVEYSPFYMRFTEAASEFEKMLEELKLVG